LLFELINRRHEKKSTLITTNKSFSAWPEVFPGASCVVAMIDRLVHHAEILAIKGESYRRKEAQEQAAARSRKRSAKAAT
jgi:DNA replication protein DnaC